jgi:hypothetical protein
VPGGGGEPLVERGIRAQRAARSERPARPVVGEYRLGEHELAEPQLTGERPARPDPQQPPGAQGDQLLRDDRGARAAHPGALDGQQLAVGRRAGVPPQPAVVVEHLGALEQVLGEP